jgi:serine/threonine protein kinase/formylglycine-generating enzyme required for sulfatase activity
VDVNDKSRREAAKVTDVFLLAWQQPEELREKMVKAVGKSDLSLIEQVTKLLRAAMECGVGPSKLSARDWLESRIRVPQVQVSLSASDPLEAFRIVGDLDVSPRTKDAQADSVGKVFGDFEILKALEDGAMGTIWMAKQLSLGRIVALKTYRSDSEASEAARSQFLKAAQLAAKLQHPNIVVTYNAGLEGDTLYYVMEYIEGVTLKRVMQALSDYAEDSDPEHLARLPEELRMRMRIFSVDSKATDSTLHLTERGKQQMLRNALAFMVSAYQSVIDAIEHAHRLGIVHGDIKPSNLMFDKAGRLMVLDFGLARSITLAEEQEDVAQGGTARYMSPEQLTGIAAVVGPSADIYALGAILYEIIALRPAYDAPTRESVLASIVRGEVEPIQSVNPKVHRDLAFIVEKAMRRQSKRRYGTASDMGKDLATFLARQPVAEGGGVFLRLLRTPFREHPFIASVAACGLVMMLTFASWQLASLLDRAESRKAIEGHMASVQQCLDAAAAEVAGDIDRSRLAKMEWNIERAIRSLGCAIEGGVDPARGAELRRKADKSIASTRVRAYYKDGQEQLGSQFLEEAVLAGIDMRDVLSDLLAAKELAGMRIDCDEGGGLTVSIRRTSYRDKSTSVIESGRSVMPADFQSLTPGEYIVEVIESGFESIRFPLLLKKGLRSSVRIPIRPSKVPTGMVYVPCGDHEESEFGFHETSTGVGSYGMTRRTIFGSFFLDRFEVTNSQFHDFLKEPRCMEWIEEEYRRIKPADHEDEFNITHDQIRPVGWMLGKPPEGAGKKPVTLVNTWACMSARLAYARWTHPEATIPTGYEWERAARGLGSRIYPYGDEFVLENHWSPMLGDVGSHPKDVSVYGIYDMLGSVPECVQGPAGTHFVDMRGATHLTTSPRDCHLAATIWYSQADSDNSWNLIEKYFASPPGSGFRRRLAAPTPQYLEEVL